MLNRARWIPLAILLLPLLAHSQSVTYTPNLNLAQPPYQYPNWNTLVNNNFSIIDTVAGSLQRQYQGVWLANKTYLMGQTVTDTGGSYYISATNNNKGNVPATSPTIWTKIPISSGGTSGVSSLNGQTGAQSLVAGPNITIVPNGTNQIQISSSGGATGVLSLNTQTGAQSLTAGPNIVITPNGTNQIQIGVTGLVTGVTSLNTQTGAQTLVGDASITVTPNGSNQIALHATATGTGVTLQTGGVNNLSQTLLNLQAGAGIAITNPSGGNVSIASTATGNTTSTALSTNLMPKANGPNSLVNSSLKDDGTAVSTTEPVTAGASLGTTADGVHPSDMFLVGNTTLPTLSPSTFNLIGPNLASFTAYGIQAPSAMAAGILHVGAPTSNVLPLTSGPVSLSADVSGNLPVGNLNSGTGASGLTFWRGDGIWSVPFTLTTTGTSGPATFTGGTLNVPQYGGGGGGLPTGASGNTPVYLAAGTTVTASAATTTTSASAGAPYGINNPTPVNQLDFVGSYSFLGSGPTSNTTNTVAIAPGDTTITVASTTGYPPAGYLLIGSNKFTGAEIVSYPSKTATTFNSVTRALFGTPAQTLSTGANVILIDGFAADSIAADPKWMSFWHGSFALYPDQSLYNSNCCTGAGLVIATNLNMFGAGISAQTFIATGNVDGTVPTTITTGSAATIGSSFRSGNTWNQNATAAAAVNYTLPAASPGLHYCMGNSWNGTAATTGVLTIATSGSGQFIIFTDGTLSATGGNVTSGGAAADFACMDGIDSTHWQLAAPRGTWAKH